MKKVRYLATAAGLAPALGMMMPAGNAVAAGTQAPANQHKTAPKAVSLTPVQATHLHNIGGCVSHTSVFQNFSSRGFSETVHGKISASCISYISATLTGGHTQLLMRTRFYNKTGGKIGNDHFNSGNRVGSVTLWKHTETTNAFEACVALVVARSSPPKYGPICANTAIIGRRR